MSYLFCESRKEAQLLEDKARRRVPSILQEFGAYFNTEGKLGIEVHAAWKGFTWSVEAELTFDGKIVKTYPAFDLLELDLLNMELSAMPKSIKIEMEGKS